MTKGFITIATGKEYYYKLAANLVQSYRFHTTEPLPFAIIAEEENEYTSIFDDVIVTKDSRHSFMDKFLLLSECPYDENIFLDADSLAYGDLNRYWTLFEGASDFSAIGGNVPVEQDDGGVMYSIEGIGKFGKNLKYKCWVHAGVMFIRKSPALKKFLNDCNSIIDSYDNLSILRYSGSYDEIAFGIAMPMNEFKTVPEIPDMLAFMPCVTNVKADIVKGSFSYNRGQHVDNVIFAHFTNRITRLPLYRYETARLNHAVKKKDTIEGIFKATVFYYWILVLCNGVENIVSIFKRAYNRFFGKHV